MAEFRFLTAGESHGPALTVILEGLPAGLRLDPEKGEFLFRYGGTHFICDVWLFRQDVEAEAVVLQEGETDGVMLASAEEIRALEARDAMVKFEYLERVLERE